tara:strand:- start:401 stop:1363 length:963 start_codon:yes stop_codon:yes gene_type:complete
MGKSILTIGIPTYNRREIVTSCLENLEKDSLLENLETLVIDNFSSDGTFKSLLKKFKQKNLRILQNDENIGFSGNTLELIKQCETDYLLWNPDEDKIIKSNVDPLIEFLIEKKPMMLCPQYYVNNKLYRGRNSSSLIKPKDLWEVAPHFPGLIFHIPSCKSFLDEFDQIKKDYPSTYRYYPQIFLVSRLILLGNCFYWDKPINTENHIAKDTHPLDDSGVGYFGLGSRWTTHKEMVDFLKKLSIKEKDNKKAQALYLVQKKRLFKVIRQAIENERPELLIDFDRGFINRISGLFYSSLINLFLHPINSLRKILRLLSLKE